MRKRSFILIMGLLILVLAGCNTNETEEGNNSEEQAENNPSTSEEENDTLKIGIMPAVDGAPIFVAESEGYFEELGLDLEVTIYSNANNRQSALQTNELDGAMTDLVAVLNNHHNGFETKLVTSTDGSFAFLTQEDFDGEGTKDLGLMEISVSNYLADYYVAPNYDVNKVFINEIPARLEMINTGQLDIGFIPEPAASTGELNGLTKYITVTDDNGSSLQAMVFTTDSYQNNHTAIAKFVQGYNKAVEAIQEDHNLALDALLSELDLNPEIRELIHLPDYQLARVPSEDYVNQVISWVEEVQDMELDVDYQEMITTEFLNQ